MDLVARRLVRDGREIDLLPREFKLLEYFMRRPGLAGDAPDAAGRRLELSVQHPDQCRGRSYAQSSAQARRARREKTDRQSSRRRIRSRCRRVDLARSTPLRLAVAFALAIVSDTGGVFAFVYEATTSARIAQMRDRIRRRGGKRRRKRRTTACGAPCRCGSPAIFGG